MSIAFDGGMLSPDAGVLLLRRVERRLGIASRLAACRDAGRIEYRREELLRCGWLRSRGKRGRERLQ